ncbi:MAG TPA: hypothetical protein VFR21_09260 [Bradyrhizobium sp.]|nr:hypothetical protein [Bradyrhizobium sp.]
MKLMNKKATLRAMAAAATVTAMLAVASGSTAALAASPGVGTGAAYAGSVPGATSFGSAAYAGSVPGIPGTLQSRASGSSDTGLGSFDGAHRPTFPAAVGMSTGSGNASAVSGAMAGRE